MNAEALETHLVAYLGLREALGFQMREAKRLLPQFVMFLKASPNPGPIRTQRVPEWACQTSTQRGPSGAARRLSIARGFLSYLKASFPDTEVPAPDLLPHPRRPKPFLFTPAHITRLLHAAQTRRPRGTMHPHTLTSVLGLLASTGLRVGEAIGLQIDHVKLDLQLPQLSILDTKFHKSRIVPLHASTAEHLRHYHTQRASGGATGVSEAFFVSRQGQYLQYPTLRDWFAQLCQHVAIVPMAGERQPSLMAFRHTFAVTRLQRWYEQGLDVQALLPHLSVYLGHIHPQESYWYLSSVPQLLSAAAHRCETFAPNRREAPCIAS